MRAYVMIETRAGKAESVVKELRNRPPGRARLQLVDTVTGNFDIIAVLLAPDVDSIGKAVSDSIQSVEGVAKTTTCLVIGG